MTIKDIIIRAESLAGPWVIGVGLGLFYFFFLFSLVKLDPILCDCILEKSEQHTDMKLPWDSLLTR